jgi:hypothetical protein
VDPTAGLDTHTHTHTYTLPYKMNNVYFMYMGMVLKRRSQWPRGLWHGSTAARFLGLWVRIPQGAWMSVSCECCVLSGRDLCDGLVTRPVESYRVWCVSNV